MDRTNNTQGDRTSEGRPHHPQAPWDIVKNLITFNSEEIKQSLTAGVVSRRLIEIFGAPRFNDKEVVSIITHGLECLPELGSVLDMPLLRRGNVI